MLDQVIEQAPWIGAGAVVGGPLSLGVALLVFARKDDVKDLALKISEQYLKKDDFNRIFDEFKKDWKEEMRELKALIESLRREE